MIEPTNQTKNDVTEIHLVRNIVDPAVNKIKQTFRVALAGKVSTFARETTRAGVTLMVRLLGMDRIPREEPGVVDSPIIIPRGGGYGMHFDLRPEDPVVTLCTDGPVWGYYETGQPVTPQIPTGHQYGTTVTFAGGRVSSSQPGQAVPPPNATGTCWIGAEDGSATCKFSGATIPSPAELGTVVIAAGGPSASLKLGSDNSADPVACANEVLANLQALANAIAVWVPLAPPAIDNGASLKAVFSAWIAALQPMGDLKAVVDGPIPLP